MEKIQIKFGVSNTDPESPLQLQVHMDNKLLGSLLITQPIDVVHDLELEDGDHELCLTLQGKITAHTVIDDQGKIIKDAMLQFSGVEMDDINIDSMLQKLAVYTHDFNGSGVSTQDSFFHAQGCNGTVSLKFTSPVYLWLLENM
jgi:hypothetical protein